MSDQNEMLTRIENIVTNINNNNKLQIIKKYYVEEWDWMLSEVKRIFPNYNASDKEILYLAQNPKTKIICDCGMEKKYYNGQYRCIKDCPTTKLNRKQTNKRRYGVEHYSQSEECKRKVKKTTLKNFGTSNPSSSEIIKERKRQTTLKNFGCDFPMQNQEVKKKRIQTFIDRYGCDSPTKNKEVQAKIRHTNIEKYGVEYPSQSELIKDQMCLKSLEKYGVEYPFQSMLVKKKIKDTILKRYGVYAYSQRKFSDEAWQVLNDKILFTNELLKYGALDLSKKLGISIVTIYRKHSMFGLNIIKSGGTSSYELALEQWLKCKNVDYISNDRKVLSPRELDFYLPKNDMAIEFDGLYWHSEANGKNKWYHFDKTKKCNEKNIRLIHIYEDEWMNKKEVCMDILARILKIDMKKIGARKCSVCELTNENCKNFLNENHLQGYIPASINLGLFYEDELIQLITFKHARYNKNMEWEIIRQVNKIGIQIVGGLQKLWTYFLKTYTPKTVVSYCDLRWFLGESYQKLGFSLLTTSRPQYWYVDDNKRYHRSRFTKKNCVKFAIAAGFSIDNPNLTEKIIATEMLGLTRIWDCGQQTWVWRS